MIIKYFTMTKHIIPAALAVFAMLAVACGPARVTVTSQSGYKFPAVAQGGKTAIVAHRGFWKCEAGGNSQNSIAALKAAQDNGLWGSECDLQLTRDGVVIVNHNDEIDGLLIRNHDWSELSTHLLPNGERRPTIDEYLEQTAKCKTTKLIIEFKEQKEQAKEDELVDKTFAAIKAHRLDDPERVLFISFSKHICEKIAAEHPQYVNQFLTSRKAEENLPTNFEKLGINGVDYHYNVFRRHPDWVENAHKAGMSVNAWTVDKKSDINAMIELGLDQITSNEPLLVRELLKDKEYRLSK